MSRGKRHNEWLTQYEITISLTSMVDEDNKGKRRELKDKIYFKLTNGFWYRKFGAIRQILKEKSISDKGKCEKIQRILDMPYDEFMDYIKSRS